MAAPHRTPPADTPLLFFDSGIGGLSVLDPTLALLPTAPVVYAADLAGLPYGDKSEMVVATRVCALLGRLTERFAPRLIVIACNTASTIALAHVRSVLEVPVVGTVPAIKPAAFATRTGVIGLLGTEATLRQPYVDDLAATFAADKRLLRHAAPGLVAAAEEKLRGGTPDSAIFDAAIAGVIAQHPDGERLDTLVLGCTHFPLVTDELDAAIARRGLAQPVRFIDGGDGIARRVTTLTAGQDWPASPPPRTAVLTGDPAGHAAYAAALSARGIGAITAL